MELSSMEYLNFERTALLAGDDMMTRLADTRILIFGVGGVGSWCVEALARTGFRLLNRRSDSPR